MKEHDIGTLPSGIAELAGRYRNEDAAFARWAAGFGAIAHVEETQVRIHDIVGALTTQGRQTSGLGYIN